MSKIKWYGPTTVLLITILLVLIGGPSVARKLAFEHDKAQIVQIKNGLDKNVTLAELSESFKKVAKVVKPSVVSIDVLSKSRSTTRSELPPDLHRWFFGPEGQNRAPKRDDKSDQSDEFDKYNVPRQYGNGSGWVYRNDGYIITNNHVIEGADKIVVRFHDGSERDAKVVGVDVKTDIAVLKVEGDRLHAAAIADEPVEQGEMVFAFGSPFQFEFSMSQGIVSAKGRQLGILRQRRGYENFIQTDAAINPGNSGGPLTNIYGEVVGMNTAIATRTGSYNGLGFAIPIRMVGNVADQLIDEGKVRRGYLGVFIEDLDPKMARSFGYDGKGVLVVNPIENSPADKAGLKRGDIIAKLDGEPVDSADDLRGYVADLKPGSKIKVEYYRLKNPTDTKGAFHTTTITIGELPDQVATLNPGVTTPKTTTHSEVLGKLGIDAATLTKAQAESLRIEFVKGVLVADVRTGSAASAAGLRVGHVITHVMGKPVHDKAALLKELNGHDLKSGVRISIMDRDTPRFIFLELPK